MSTLEESLLNTIFAASAYPHQVTPHTLRSAANLLEQLDPVTHFHGYPKTQRYDKLTYTISEKIDGTNAGIIVNEDPAVKLIATSKNKCITPEDDNLGFAAWVQLHSAELRNLGPGHHFGEWYGRRINRNYGLTERKLMLFNVSRYRAHVVDSTLPEGVELETVLAGDVPLMMLPQFIQESRDLLENQGSRHVLGFKSPEGLIIRDSFGRIVKYVMNK